MSKKDIRPQGAEGISHPCTLANHSLTVNGSSTIFFPFGANGFRAAEQWHQRFCVAADAAEGYLFPSGLRAAFENLPIAARSDFLDAIGALLVSFQVIGIPAPGRQNLREDVQLCAMSHEEQDRWAQAQDDEGGTA
ncbi:hypothetical protein [Achromobacter sp. Root565]|uniref:hypothetical protein n=1 Tax=Achromobacter sp. Root565 TaxID=1736564 RepID=UPI0006FDB100|nr:hypothetical protein [Achromobacter sp. Root565]KQZ96165.1 hypothetical protein ASD71_26250 [Achromobacter sp. Root565]